MASLTYLVAIDPTDESGEVLKTAQVLAEKTGATLALVTVVRPLVDVYGSMSIAPFAQPSLSFEAQAQNKAQRRLDKLAANYAVEPNMVFVKPGNPAHEIVALATGLAADLIVLGDHKHSGPRRILGSTTQAVLNSLACNALVVTR